MDYWGILMQTPATLKLVGIRISFWNGSGMDTLARGLRKAAKLIEDGSLTELVRKRYESFDSEFGALIEAGKADFETLEKKAIELGEPSVASGKQKRAEMIFQSAL